MEVKSKVRIPLRKGLGWDSTKEWTSDSKVENRSVSDSEEAFPRKKDSWIVPTLREGHVCKFLLTLDHLTFWVLSLGNQSLWGLCWLSCLSYTPYKAVTAKTEKWCNDS